MTLKEKIDPSSAFIASINIPAENTAFDGLLPEENLDMVVAEGVGKFAGRLMVQVGIIERKGPRKGPIGIIYRPGPEYVGYSQGRERYIDPEALRTRTIAIPPTKRKIGLWVPLELLGAINQ